MKDIKCPLCLAPLCYQLERDTKTHMWTCRDCPFVGFEFYNVKNITGVATVLLEPTEKQSGICTACKGNDRDCQSC
jgi:hypothetical protein